jgi:hypothetical protein
MLSSFRSDLLIGFPARDPVNDWRERTETNHV